MGTRASLESAVIACVREELERQFVKWGVQNHPLGNGAWDFHLKEETQKKANDLAVQRDSLTWAGILLEEVWEALAAKDPDHVFEEMVQVAAVAIAAAANMLHDREQEAA